METAGMAEGEMPKQEANLTDKLEASTAVLNKTTSETVEYADQTKIPDTREGQILEEEAEVHNKMKIPLTVEGETPEEEAELADKLRECCSAWGVEIGSKLHDSASILLNMGRLYLEKAKNSNGMLQKLNFIKSATLISGARTRFENLLNDVEKYTEAKDLFRTMSTVLLNTCRAKEHGADLSAISDHVASSFLLFREKEKEFIKQHLSSVSDDVLESELPAEQKRKIKSMRHILKENTSFYQGMMKYVSEECIKLLGVPPCKYSLLGLGSLSREEVTLYSDFEHVILLEEGIDDSPNGKLREYFRWYSVVFQVIIIGLGETYIPTVGVKSLNDLYSDDKSRDWFFDLYTPGGVSFDGRFPHSCKIPIGKQEASVNHKFVIELIQPVDTMLQYLTSQEDLKKDYHLRDVLARTCLVHGDEDLHQDFLKRASQILARDSRDQEVASQAKFVVENVNSPVTGPLAGDAKRNFYKTKDFFYRPITLLVGSFSRVFHKYTGSNFDFLTWFQKFIEMEVPSKLDAYLHDLEYAIAVAAEIRLKIYASAGHQRQKTSPKDVCLFVSKRCVVNCYRTMCLTTLLFQKVFINETGYEDLLSNILHMNTPAMHELGAKVYVNMLDYFGFHEAALDEYERLPEQNFDAPASAYFEVGMLKMTLRDEYFRKAAEILAKNNRNDTFEYVRVMSQIYFHRGHSQKGLDLVEIWTEKFRKDQGDLESEEYIEMQKIKARISDSCKSSTEMIEYASRQMKDAPDVYSRVLFSLDLSCAQKETGDVGSSRETLRDAVQLCASNVKRMPLDEAVRILQTIFRLQVIQSWSKDAGVTLEVLDKLQGTSQRSEVDDEYFSLYEKQNLESNNLTDKDRLVTVAEYCKSHFTCNMHLYGRVLTALLQWCGISNFLEFATYFTSAPLDALCQPSVYNELHDAIKSYSMEMLNVPCHKIGEDLMRVFCTFDKLLRHPRFVGMFRDITVCLAVRTFPLKHIMACTASTYAQRSDDHASVVYNQALRDFANLDIQPSGKTFWRILNSKTKPWLWKKSCKLLAHMIGISPFSMLREYLSNQRPRFMEFLSHQKTHVKAVSYNKAVEKYIDSDFEASSSGFWRIIFNSKRIPIYRKRSIEMLMLVVLFKWEYDGFPMYFGVRYISNQPTKVLE